MLAGPNDLQVDILARAGSTGAYAKIFSTWASWRYVGGRPGTEAGFVEDEADVELRVNDTPRNRALSIANRIAFRGQSCAIAAIAPPDRASGNIVIRIQTKIGG